MKAQTPDPRVEITADQQNTAAARGRRCIARLPGNRRYNTQSRVER